VKILTFNRFSICISALSIAAYACAGGNTGELPPSDLTGSSSGANGGTGGAPPMFGGGSGGNAGTAGSGLAGASSGGTGGALPGSGGSGFIDPTPMAGTAGMGMIEEDTACGTGEANADLKPVHMMVMFDRSGSMHDCTDGTDRMNSTCPSPPSRWDTASGALKTFFASPGAADLGVALRFFPHDSPAVGCAGGNDGTCDAVACSQVLVDMGVLTVDVAPTDAHEAALIAATDMAAPPVPGMGGTNQGTPIYPALEGALMWAGTYQTAHPEVRTIVVFITDGAPNGCEDDFDQIAQLAADELAATGVTTYMIGLTDSGGGGVNQGDMDQVAAAGGTMQAFFISDGATAAQELIDTFNAIRGMAIACNFSVPMATMGGTPIDPTLLNVNYTSGTGTVVPLVKVADAASCGTEPAWYYDNEAMPTEILLCPTACTTVTADANAQIQILAGCKPRIPMTT